MKQKLFTALFWVTFISILGSINGTAQDNMKVLSVRTYNGRALWGYMNGGSDLYFEYGFKNLAVKELNIDGEQVSLTCFDMGTPENAFGIYSLHCHECPVADSLNTYECITGYQAQLVRGNYYLSISKTDGNRLIYATARTLIEKLKQEYPQEELTVPAPFLDKVAICSGKTKYIKGPLGLASTLSHWSDPFAEKLNYTIWMSTLEAGNKEVYFAYITFNNEEALNNFIGTNNFEITKNGLMKWTLNTSILFQKRIDERSILLIEAGELSEKEINKLFD